MPDTDDLRDRLNMLVQGRIEASGILVALTFGGFTILTLFGNTQLFSPAWFMLTIVYWVVFAMIWLMFPQWARTIRQIELIDKYFRFQASELRERVDEETRAYSIEKITRNYVEKSFIDRHITTIIRIALTALGIGLWLAIAFHCGIGQPLNPACS